MSFVFDEKREVMAPVLNVAGRGQFAACARLILNAGQTFVSRVMFPGLVGHIKSYELDDTYF
jgi:hypothetical protein